MLPVRFVLQGLSSGDSGFVFQDTRAEDRGSGFVGISPRSRSSSLLTCAGQADLGGAGCFPHAAPKPGLGSIKPSSGRSVRPQAAELLPRGRSPPSWFQRFWLAWSWCAPSARSLLLCSGQGDPSPALGPNLWLQTAFTALVLPGTAEPRRGIQEPLVPRM